MPDKVLPTLPSATTPGGINATPTSVRTINTLTSASSISNRAMQSHENSPITPDDHIPVRSPSMPQLKPANGQQKAVKVLGLLPTSPKFPRTASTPTTLLPSAQVTSPLTSPKMPRSPSMSKRSYLIREIATTERAYANDLALVRDAYLTRFPRPTSQHSVGTTGESPGYISDHSRRSSIYTYQTAETKRSSAHEASSTSLAAGTPGVPPKSPNAMGNGSANPSPITAARNSAVMGPPVGKPLSPADLRSVFLNLEQLAGLAEELAVAFGKAIGDDRDSAPGKEGETGSDRLGEVFASLVSPKMSCRMSINVSASPPTTSLHSLLRPSSHCLEPSARLARRPGSQGPSRRLLVSRQVPNTCLEPRFDAHQASPTYNQVSPALRRPPVVHHSSPPRLFQHPSCSQSGSRGRSRD